MKTYSNRFAMMEQQPCGGWIVISVPTGLALDKHGRFCEGDGRRTPMVHRTYASARETMLILTERYKSILRGNV